MTRKTIDRDALIKRANAMLASPELDASARAAIGFLVETTLMECNTYRGFNYQTSEKNDDGTLRDGYDETKRIIY